MCLEIIFWWIIIFDDKTEISENIDFASNATKLEFGDFFDGDCHKCCHFNVITVWALHPKLKIKIVINISVENSVVIT